MRISKQSDFAKKPIAIDLFCGCGGLTLGLRKAGFKVVGAVELDHLAAETYRKNHPSVHVWESDIQKLDPAKIQKQLGLAETNLSLLAGCPPCQGFSRLRTKNGAIITDDQRNNLLFEFERFAKVFRPKVLMLENVPSLADDHRFSIFLDKIDSLGYQGEYQILDAADFDVPQRRKRLIFLAGLYGCVPFAPPLVERRTVRDAIASLPQSGHSGDPLHDLRPVHIARVQNIIHNVPKDGGSRSSLPEEMWLNCHKKNKGGFKDVYGRMAWDRVAPTITSGCFNPSKGRFLHPEEDRAITLREAAILQGFPKKYIFPADNRSAVGTMIGNALPPPFITAHAKKIKEYLL
ncbi:MAG: DNA cytosine methyltransferase [Planctomycetaceae bacterium]|jgi:DNA (cytosine-5)-methyltransferase 1|nr:DNA cytosine methyltransferase [Planctomycetaceae bacterium]